ncbi:MAG: ABC transporter substrate-binding protein, partial [Planctomycetota bacterium]|nr:ABC transporter substrate-binding protein [Planctomycetota bacterium]
VHQESGISRFEDLEGVTLAVGSDTAFYKFMQQKVELKNVKLVSYSGSNASFLADKSYAQQAYSISEPILVKRKGARPVSLMLSDLGFNPYTSCLFVSEKYLTTHPELIHKFVKATQQGWIDYIANPKPANTEMEKLNKEHDLEALNEGATAASQLCQPDSSHSVGSMTEKRWNDLVSQLQSIGMLKPDFQLGKAFTVDFLPENQ